MSVARKGKKKTLEHRAKIGEAQQGNKNGLGRKDSAEVRLKRSASLKAAWARRKAAASPVI